MPGRKRQILLATLAIADERGLSAVSMRSVAERVGVSAAGPLVHGPGVRSSPPARYPPTTGWPRTWTSRWTGTPKLKNGEITRAEFESIMDEARDDEQG